ncbi:MAG: ferrous iron transporter B [Deltaproteobacteria bacterium]|nr:ferrous iron transporter B [Deltaproteobacteria bacterium]
MEGTMQAERIQEQAPLGTVVIAGLESVGKSAVFRLLTGWATGDEANFRGSTVHCRRAEVAQLGATVVDTPGVRLRVDGVATRLALAQVGAAETVLVVVRGTHLASELAALREVAGSALRRSRLAFVVTFRDRAPADLEAALRQLESAVGCPVLALDARRAGSAAQRDLIELVGRAALPRWGQLPELEGAVRDLETIVPRATIFEHRWLGGTAAVLSLLLLFGLPVYGAFVAASALQPLIDGLVIEPVTRWLAPLGVVAPVVHALLAGDYGVLTLGWYSFLWAFPVVVLVGLSVALSEESGLKDRITNALDAPLRVIGLSGRDLLPVLTGFGCNVVAVFQTRACSACSRKACVSLIAYGAACSYQIGAALSLFGSGGRPWLFAPYVALLFVVGAVHTRIWNRAAIAQVRDLPVAERAFLQRPALRATWWRLRTVLRQFLFQAMPVFLLICAAGALLAHFGLLDVLATALGPALAWLSLPPEVAPGVVFSVIRKDGLLVLNEGQGTLLASLGTGQLLLLVYLASTLTACLVTLCTVRSEMGGRFAMVLAARQAATSVVTSMVLAAGLRAFG